MEYKVNLFIDFICSIRGKKDLKSTIKKYLFFKKLDKMVPTFNVLWEITEALNLLELIFLYDNNNTNELYLVRTTNKKDKNIAERTIVINVTPYQDITIVLNSNLKTIRIEIHTIHNNNKLLRSHIEFKDGCAEVNNAHDEHLFITINDLIMNSFSRLLKKYAK